MRIYDLDVFLLQKKESKKKICKKNTAAKKPNFNSKNYIFFFLNSKKVSYTFPRHITYISKYTKILGII